MAMTETGMVNDAFAFVEVVLNTRVTDLTTAQKNAIKDAWKEIKEEEYKGIIKHIKENMVIDGYKLFAGGTPAPNDGGAALKTAWSLPANTLGNGDIS